MGRKFSIFFVTIQCRKNMMMQYVEGIMTRSEMLIEYNYYTRKRESYKEKLSKISNVRTELDAVMDDCITYRDELSNYGEDSNMFYELADDNFDRFPERKKQDILDMLDGLETYVSNQITLAQDEIDKWDYSIRQHDKEQEEENEG